MIVVYHGKKRIVITNKRYRQLMFNAKIIIKYKNLYVARTRSSAWYLVVKYSKYRIDLLFLTREMVKYCYRYISKKGVEDRSKR